MNIGRDLKTHKVLKCKTIEEDSSVHTDCKNCNNRERCEVPRRTKRVLQSLNQIMRKM